jgi:hypothetical protein
MCLPTRRTVRRRYRGKIVQDTKVNAFKELVHWVIRYAEKYRVVKIDHIGKPDNHEIHFEYIKKRK